MATKSVTTTEGSPAARATATRRSSAGSKRSAKSEQTGELAGTRVTRPDLRPDLRRFVTEHPGGWGHDEWLGFLEHLRGRGHNVSDSDQVGRMLEQERLITRLEGVSGVGRQRVRAIVARYETLWNLRQAESEDLARSIGIPRTLAERIKETVQT